MPKRFHPLPLLLSLLLTALPSCMKDRPEELPSQLQWNPQLALPLGQDAFGMNEDSGFPDYLFEIDPATGLPYWVDRDVLRMWGSMEFDLDALNENKDHIEQLLFRINLENGFPHEMHVQGYFVDRNRQPLDSLFDKGAIRLPPASVGDQGQVLQTIIVRPPDIVYSKERILLLDAATDLVLQGQIFHPEVDTALVDYYPQFIVKADVGVMMDLSIDYLTWQ